MTYETVDNFLTLAITVLLYGTGLWLVAAFTIFVATHPKTSQLLQAPVSEAKATPPVQSETLLEAQMPIQTEVSEPPLAGQITIVVEPVDFSRWKVADLRCPKLRESFGIPLREKGQTRAYRKTELEALYYQAMASTA